MNGLEGRVWFLLSRKYFLPPKDCSPYGINYEVDVNNEINNVIAASASPYYVDKACDTGQLSDTQIPYWASSSQGPWRLKNKTTGGKTHTA